MIYIMILKLEKYLSPIKHPCLGAFRQWQKCRRPKNLITKHHDQRTLELLSNESTCMVSHFNRTIYMVRHRELRLAVAERIKLCYLLYFSFSYDSHSFYGCVNEGLTICISFAFSLMIICYWNTYTRIRTRKMSSEIAFAILFCIGIGT